MVNKSLSLSLVFLLLIDSCTCNTIRKNQPQDKAEAEAIIQDFYHFSDSNDSVQLASLFGRNFFKAVDTPQLFSQLAAFKNKLGIVDTIHLEYWETNITEDITSTASIYVLKYAVKRQKFMAVETFTLEKENGKVKILGYHIDNAIPIRNESRIIDSI